MDPDETLRVIREDAKEIIERGHSHDELVDLAEELANAVADLDEWLVNGGFPPGAWLTGVLAKRPQP